MFGYFKKSYKKLKEDALAKAIYDLCKYLLGLFVAYVVLNRIPINTVIGEFLQSPHSFNYLQVFIVLSVTVLITVLIQFLFNKKRFATIKKDLHTDELTGLPNKRALEEEIKDVVSLAKKERKNLSVILMDIDDFKIFNTKHGQIIADEVLKKFGRMLKSDSRITDKVYRQHIKGDEFVIIAKDTSLNNAVLAANRKRELIEKTGIEIEINGKKESLLLTVCCGVVELNIEKDNEITILERAHSAMIQAKNITGKNNTKSLI